MRLITAIFALIFIIGPLSGQDKHWIYFTDKGAVNDLDSPLSEVYLDSLHNMGVTPVHQSLWLNAVSAELSVSQASLLSKIDFIKSLEPVKDYEVMTDSDNPETDLYFSLEQINAQAFVEAGLSGKKVKIGILDGGFQDASRNNTLKKIFDEERVVASRDFVTKKDLFDNFDESSKDWHGTIVWKFIGGITPQKQYGLSPNAEYYLARTEHGDREYRGEEDNWVAAIEWMHSQGVRLVNSSLGYSIGFTNPDENYSPEQMDGKTTAISRAAQIAVEKKNMILVASAGNDGDNNKWRVITTPADAEGVITVGSTKRQYWSKAGYSAIGTDLVKFIKPNVVCYSGTGTSFSAPVITGLIGCMLEMDSTLSSKEITDILHRSGHLSAFPNNYLGYGVPNCKLILDELENETVPKKEMVISARDNYYVINVKELEDQVLVFHKKDRTQVIAEKVLRLSDSRTITIHRHKNAKYTTVHSGEKAFEIRWK